MISCYERDTRKLLDQLLATEEEDDFKSGLCAAVGILNIQEARIKKLEEQLSEKNKG